MYGRLPSGAMPLQLLDGLSGIELFIKKVWYRVICSGMIGAVATRYECGRCGIQLNSVAGGSLRGRSSSTPRLRLAPGHWQWTGNRTRHVWVAGNWQRVRPATPTMRRVGRARRTLALHGLARDREARYPQ